LALGFEAWFSASSAACERVSSSCMGGSPVFRAL
jgi:hypothetical protein